MAHLAALALTHHDVLRESQNAPDGSEPSDQFTTDSSDSSFEVEKAIEKELNLDGSEVDEVNQVNGYRRLSCFQIYTQPETLGTKCKNDETQYENDLSLAQTDESICQFTRTSSSFVEKDPRAMDFENCSLSSFEVCE